MVTSFRKLRRVGYPCCVVGDRRGASLLPAAHFSTPPPRFPYLLTPLVTPLGTPRVTPLPVVVIPVPSSSPLSPLSPSSPSSKAARRCACASSRVRKTSPPQTTKVPPSFSRFPFFPFFPFSPHSPLDPCEISNQTPGPAPHPNPPALLLG